MWERLGIIQSIHRHYNKQLADDIEKSDRCFDYYGRRIYFWCDIYAWKDVIIALAGARIPIERIEFVVARDYAPSFSA
jgi:hypothetical protein